MTIDKSMFRFVIAALLIVAASGCEDTLAPELPEVARVELTVGGRMVALTRTAAEGSLTISGASANVSVKAFDADGGEIALDPADFELRLTPSNAALLTFVHLTG